MSEFIKFRDKVNKQLDEMSKYELFVVDVDKDLLYKTYLESFKEGTNPIYKERTEHDCQCCKQFIRNIGNVVAIIHDKVVSVWDITTTDIYQPVSDAMSDLVKSCKIRDVYRHFESTVGQKSNHQLLESGIKTWNHFYYKLPRVFVMTNSSIPSYQGKVRTNKEVLERSLDVISVESAEVVLDLILQNSIYRGKEFKGIVQKFLEVKRKYLSIEDSKKEVYLWNKSLELKELGRFKNTVIGTLLEDLSSGVELDVAVGKYESKVAPHNYKRSSALVTNAMKKKAYEKIVELGYEESLQRRYATVEDLTINNVLFADRSSKKSMGVLEEILCDDNTPNLSRVEEVSVGDFVKNILPSVHSMKVMVENTHTNNLMSVIAPVDKSSKGIFKWGNNFSWAYNGDVTDSMKQRVKSAGGNIVADLRFSIQWNEEGDNQNDFDAHAIEPRNNKIYFGNKKKVHPSSGMLDVDIRRPENNIAVENITWADKDRMPDGVYKLLVHNFHHRGGTSGFRAEIEFDNKIHSFSYNKNVKHNEYVTVAEIEYTKKGGFKILNSLPSSVQSQTVWGIETHKWADVSLFMNSPNHWDGEETGNKHWFFILKGCCNPIGSRGFYNEFLKAELNEHRKVFEMLGDKMKTPNSIDQLSGVGFSSTQKNEIICQVSGNFNRVIKIKF